MRGPWVRSGQAAVSPAGATPVARSRDLAAAAKVAGRKLDLLDYAAQLDDLASPPGNRLEALKGDLLGFHSIRVNERWRVVFRWTDAGPEAVDVVDYH